MSAIGSSSYPPYGSGIESYPTNPEKSPAKTPSKLRRDSTAYWQTSNSSTHLFSEKSPEEKSLYLTRKKSSELIDQATDFFEKSPHPEPVKCNLEQKDFPLILDEIFKTKAFKGLCIGEHENYIAPKKLLIENMQRLKDLGVTTLFLEHIKYDVHQQELDDWFEQRITNPVDTTEFLSRLDEKYRLFLPYSFTELVYKAHEVGIRVIAIDSSASAIAGNHCETAQSYVSSAKQRIKALNFKAIQIMTERISGKYIVLTGTDHGSTTLTYEKIPGISELMQCPFVIISDSSEYKIPGVRLRPEVPYDLGYRNKPGTVHAIIVLENAISSPRRRTL